jgi:hypothetical protein
MDSILGEFKRFFITCLTLGTMKIIHQQACKIRLDFIFPNFLTRMYMTFFMNSWEIDPYSPHLMCEIL